MAAGVSVTSYVFRLLPPWLVWGGLVIAVVGELSTLSLITLPMAFADSDHTLWRIRLANRRRSVDA